MHNRTNPKLLERATHIAITRYSEHFARVFPVHKDDVIALLYKSSLLQVIACPLSTQIFCVKANSSSISLLTINKSANRR